MITRIDGALEIDHERAVIWFTSFDMAVQMRICQLPKPVPDSIQNIDITHMTGASYESKEK